MTIKLNLTIKESTVQKAKIYAARNNTSVSKLVDEYLGRITSTPVKNEFKFFVEKYAGILKNRKKAIDVNQERNNYLKEKYDI